MISIRVADLRSFNERQRCAHIEVVGPDGTHDTLFENGAVFTRFNEEIDPPTDPRQLAFNQLRYSRIAFNREVAAYRAASEAVSVALTIARQSRGPIPSPVRFDELEAGRERIEKLKHRLVELEEVTRDPQEQARREAQARQDELRDQAIAQAQKRLADLPGLSEPYHRPRVGPTPPATQTLG